MKVNEKPRENHRSNTSRQATGIATGGFIYLVPRTLSVYKNANTKLLSDDRIQNAQVKQKKKYFEVNSFENIYRYAQDIITRTGLKDKGLEIKVWTPESFNQVNQNSIFQNASDRLLAIKKINKMKMWANGVAATFRPPQGNNSSCINIGNKIMHFAVFHEIGHASNYYNNGFTKFIQQNRKYFIKATPLVAFCTLCIGLAHNKKTNHDKKSKFSKFKDFIHDNAGKLTFLTYTPILFEEATASIKGAKLARPYLTKTQNKQHIINLLKGFMSYCKTPLKLSLLVAAGIFVKDKIVRSKNKN